MRHLDTHETRAAYMAAYAKRQGAIRRLRVAEADYGDAFTRTSEAELKLLSREADAADDMLTEARAAHSLAQFCAGQPESFADNRQVIAAAASKGVSLIVQLECGPADIHSPRVTGAEALARIEVMDEDEAAHVQVVGILPLPEVC